jgi:hypothetical protein
LPNGLTAKCKQRDNKDSDNLRFGFHIFSFYISLGRID